MKQLPQLCPRVFERLRAVIPVAAARGDWKKSGVHHADLSQVLEDLGVFVVLNAIANGLQSNPGSRLRGGDRTRRVEEDSVTRPSQAAATGGRIQIAPTADGISGSPSVRAVVKDTRGALRPIQKPCLDAFVDWWIVHHPFRSVAEARIATGIAPEVAPASE